jgi:sugar lactone lactonase YvrE
VGINGDVDALMKRPVAPDGLCLNREGAVWVANPLRSEVTCVTASGEIVDRVELSQPGIACMLGGPERRTLFITTGELAQMTGRSGKIEYCQVAVPGAGYPSVD